MATILKLFQPFLRLPSWNIPIIFISAILDFYLYFLWLPSWIFKFAAILNFPTIYMTAILDFDFSRYFYGRHLGFRIFPPFLRAPSCVMSLHLLFVYKFYNI